MWANAQRHGRPAKYRWRPLLNTTKFVWRHYASAVQQRCLYRRAQDLDAKWILHLAKFRYGARAPENVYIMYQPRRWPNILSPKQPNWSQPLVDRSSPYCEDMRGRYCCLTGFFPIVDMYLSCEDIARQCCAVVCRWRFFASCIFSEPRAAHFRPAS